MDSIVKKYSLEKGGREKLVRELNGIISEFSKIRQKLKMQTPFKMKIATLAPDGTAWIVPASDLVIPILADISQGVLNITLYTGGVMGEDLDILRKMKMGQLHGCGCTAQGIISAAPELSVFSLPFLLKDYKEVDYVLKMFRKDIDSIFERRGIALFALIDTGYFYLFMKNRASTLEEVKNQKFLTWFGETERAFLGELGITPIPLPVPEVVMSLRSGIVNADIAPAAWVLGTQAYLSVDYFIEQPVFYSVAAIVLDKKALLRDGARYGLTEKETDTLLRFSIKLTKIIRLEEVWNDRLREYEKKCMKAFMDHGMKPLRLSDADIESMEATGRKVWDKLADKVYPRDLMERMVRAIAEYRQKGGTRGK